MQTLFSSADAGTVKKWAVSAMAETAKASYLMSRMAGDEDQRLPVVVRNELESGAGDEVTIYLVAKIVGKPVQGTEKLEGATKRLTDYTDKVKIEKQRLGVSIGDLMAQKRRPYSLRAQARDRTAGYWAEVLDSEAFQQLNGRRGTGLNHIHFDVNYTGFPHTFVAPSADSVLYPNAIASAATLTAGDTMGTQCIDKAILSIKTTTGGNVSKPWGRQPCMIEGSEYFVMVMHPAQMYDLRREVGDAGWLTLEKARISAVGNNSPVFKGGSTPTVLYNGTILHEHNLCTYTADYGASANIKGFRATVMGAHSLAMAWGTLTKAGNAPRMSLDDSSEDHGSDAVLVSTVVCGIKRTQFANKDFAALQVDTAASTAAQAALQS